MLKDMRDNMNQPVIRVRTMPDTMHPFVGYEYRTITVRESISSLYIDGYQNFGWEIEGQSEPSIPARLVTLKFKRDRKILNKAELTRLQRQFDSCIQQIEALEMSKTVKASIYAFSVGLLGCGFFAGSVFAVSTTPANIVLCAGLGVPGCICWMLPYFLFCHFRDKRIAQITPMIEQKYDEIYRVCEKGYELLI